MTATVIAYSVPAGEATEHRYSWSVGTLTEGRRNLRGLARRGIRGELVRADGRVEYAR